LFLRAFFSANETTVAIRLPSLAESLLISANVIPDPPAMRGDSKPRKTSPDARFRGFQNEASPARSAAWYGARSKPQSQSARPLRYGSLAFSRFFYIFAQR